VTGGEYLAIAYGVVFVFVLAYVGIIAAKLARLQRETSELLELARREQPAAQAAEPVTPREAPRGA
jgi:CcmD family protein